MTSARFFACILLLHVSQIRAQQAAQQSTATLTKVAAATLAVAVVGSAVYAGKGTITQALASIRSLPISGLPLVRSKSGFSKKTLIATGLAAFTGGALSLAIPTFFIVRTLLLTPGDQLLCGLAHAADRAGYPDDAQVFAYLCTGLREAATKDDKFGMIARFMIDNLRYWHVPGGEAGPAGLFKGKVPALLKAPRGIIKSN